MEQQLQQERIVIENDDEIEIDLKDLVLEILSFWKWVLFALIIGAVTAYCISRFVMVPQYESTSQFYVLSKSMSITSLADIQTGTSLTNDYMVIVEGRPVLEQVIENLGLDETYSSLKKKVTLNNPSNSRILEITVRDANPSMAKKIADEIARVSVAFIQQKMDQDAPNIIQKGYSDGEPVSTVSPSTTSGRFTSIPSVARSFNCSSSPIPGNLSFNCMLLYKSPLVLKNFFNGSPLFSYHSFNSS